MIYHLQFIYKWINESDFCNKDSLSGLDDGNNNLLLLTTQLYVNLSSLTSMGRVH